MKFVLSVCACCSTSKEAEWEERDRSQEGQVDMLLLGIVLCSFSSLYMSQSLKGRGV